MSEPADINDSQRRDTAPTVRAVPEFEPRERGTPPPDGVAVTVAAAAPRACPGTGGPAPRGATAARGMRCAAPVRTRRRGAGVVRPINRILPSQPELVQFLRWMIEVRDGLRSVATLRCRLEPALADRLRYHAPRARRSAAPHVLLRHAFTMPNAEAMEIWGAVRRGDRGRVTALVARIEQYDLGWRCTAFRLLDGTG